MDLPFRQRYFAGIPFARTSLQDACDILAEKSKNGPSGAGVHLLNAYSIALAQQDESFRSCLEQSSCNLPDGKPLAVLTKWSDKPLKQVRGPSLFELLMDEGRTTGLRHYLLGSTPETLQLLRTSLESRYPGVQIVGTMSPPFRELTPQELVEQDAQVRLAEPNIVWVGLGTPKQDLEVQRLAGVGFFAIAIGAAFDFSAGTKREAPQWMAHVGLEWLYRLLSEPRRLWKRYVFGNIRFLLAAIRGGR
ncbi:WecB/TagA/CpsF family glycosyltransferase [Arthrobacter crystallopoietes]|uniref:WecB/TagA/CpsF family glycosyltransferase n=1 Tax=Crystallibacter crystallopoietes TaxID=37928 RepID=UPI00111107D6|nr:WecB/TagA/CpsF family glycosyltransferase [Arthrobacter crystallopoietes]